jgi:hypothetical protein
VGDDLLVSNTVVRPTGSKFYYVKSEQELQAEMEADMAVGLTTDSAGEPRLYARIASSRFTEDTPVTITRRRGIPWPHWRKKPPHLVEGLATIRGVPRIIMFQDGVKSTTKRIY